MKSSFAARWNHPRRLKAVKPDSRVRCPRLKQVWVYPDTFMPLNTTEHVEGAIATKEETVGDGVVGKKL